MATVQIYVNFAALGTRGGICPGTSRQTDRVTQVGVAV